MLALGGGRRAGMSRIYDLYGMVGRAAYYRRQPISANALGGIAHVDCATCPITPQRSEHYFSLPARRRPLILTTDTAG